MLILAFILGVVAGLRVFTGVGVWFLHSNGLWRILAPIAALGEYVADAMPWIPARTTIFPSVILRTISGGFAGWLVSGRMGGSVIAAIAVGVVGAVIGTFGGYSVRIWLIDRIGAVPAAIVEDVIAIALAVGVVHQTG